MATQNKQLSMAASAIALRGVRLFLTAGRAAAERRPPPAPPAPAPNPRPRPKPPVFDTKPSQKVFDMLLRSTKFNKKNDPSRTLSSVSERSPTVAPVHTSAMPRRKLKEKHLEVLFKITHFSKSELEALYSMYRRLVTAAQAAAPTTAIGQPPKIESIDQSTFRDVMHNTFDLVTEETVLERMWVTWERGTGGGEGSLRFEAWVRGLSVLLKGTNEERRVHCFHVYDLNSDGYITKDEMFILLKNSLLKQPGDEDPDEGVRDLVELVLRKLDVDKDGRVSLDDYRQAVDQEPLLLEAFGQCLPTKRHAAAFIKTLTTKS